MRVDVVAPNDCMFSSHDVIVEDIGQKSNHMKTDALEVDIEPVMGGIQCLASPIESKSWDDISPYSSSPKLHSYADIERSIKADENVGGHTENSYSITTAKIGTVEARKAFYSHTEVGMPEVVAGFTNGTSAVKDICIDEGVCFCESVFKEGKEDQDDSSRFNQAALDENYDTAKDMSPITTDANGTTDCIGPGSDGMRASSVNELVDNRGTGQCSLGSTLTGGGSLNRVTPFNGTSTDKQLICEQKTDTDLCQADTSSVDCINDQKQYSEHKKIGQDPTEERNSTTTAISSTDKDSNRNDWTNGSLANSNLQSANRKVDSGVITFHFDSTTAATLSGRDEGKENIDDPQSAHAQYVLKAEEATHNGVITSADKDSNRNDWTNGSLANSNLQSANRKVDSGVITFHFDSTAATISGRDEGKENIDNPQSAHAQYVLKAQEATHNGVITSARNSFVQQGFGDSSLFGTTYSSGSVTSSGHIPYSGNISYRSDSSTTSARSFAFPILQSEWNSSPIKMAKADRRHYRKHRGWRVALLCCRF